MMRLKGVGTQQEEEEDGLCAPPQIVRSVDERAVQFVAE